MKKILLSGLIALVLIAVAVAAVRFFAGGDEDAWICSDGQWVKHGQPSAPMPETGCPPAPAPAPAAEEPGPAIPAVLPVEMNFFEMGFLSRNEPGEKAGAWSLKYEKLGAALQTVSLVFNQDSVCTVRGQAAPCSGFDQILDLRTRVEGYRLEPPYVLVRKLLAPLR